MNREIEEDEMMRSDRTTRPAWHAPLLTDHIVADVTVEIGQDNGSDDYGALTS